LGAELLGACDGARRGLPAPAPPPPPPPRCASAPASPSRAFSIARGIALVWISSILACAQPDGVTRPLSQEEKVT